MTLSQEMKMDILWWYTYNKQFNGVSFMIDPLTTVLTYAGDACKQGAGGYHGAEYWSRILPAHMCGDDPPIHLKEFHVLLISIRLWGPSWSGQAVEMFCDNTAVVEVCTKQKPKDSEMARFLREYLMLVVTYKFYPVLKKISTTDNWCADFLSREFNENLHQAFFEKHKMLPMAKVVVPDQRFHFSESW